jgi:hypothetical protein
LQPGDVRPAASLGFGGVVSVRERVERDLAEMPEVLRESGIAGVALAMADRIDDGRGSPSECGKVVLDALTRLQALAPPKREADRLDEVTERRERRRGAGA